MYPVKCQRAVSLSNVKRSRGETWKSVGAGGTESIFHTVCHKCDRQVYSSVKWQQSVERMIADGVDTFIEIGPGRTLTGFLKKINKNVTGLHIEKVEDLDAVVKMLGEKQ